MSENLFLCSCTLHRQPHLIQTFYVMALAGLYPLSQLLSRASSALVSQACPIGSEMCATKTQKSSIALERVIEWLQKNAGSSSEKADGIVLYLVKHRISTTKPSVSGIIVL